MSQVYYTVTDDGQIVFSDSKRIFGEPEGFDPECMKTKDECLGFLGYLINRDNPVILHKLVRYSMFSANLHDLWNGRMAFFRKMKENDTAETAYVRIAKYYGTGCVNKKVRASFNADMWYREDFYEYLLTTGMDKKEACRFTEIVSCGAYKEYCKRKNKKLSEYSQELHEFALAAGLPSRDRIFDEFRYEYKLFKKAEEKERIAAIANADERNRQNALRFINSAQVRECLDVTGRKFSPLETAWLIYQCRNLTIEEKHEAWNDLIANTSDFETMEFNRHTKGRYTFHVFLKEYMEEEEKILKEFKESGERYVYKTDKVSRRRRNGQKQTDFAGVYSSLDRFTLICEALKEPADDTEWFICRKVRIDNPSEWTEVILSPVLDTVKVNKCSRDHHDYNYLASIFQILWFDFPEPFTEEDFLFDGPNPQRIVRMKKEDGESENGSSGGDNEDTNRSITILDDSHEAKYDGSLN